MLSSMAEAIEGNKMGDFVDWEEERQLGFKDAEVS